ncbi:U32 family peptidase [Verrucomicrobiota bacterium]
MPEEMMVLPELLIPAGNMSKLRTALAYGADAVYVGAAGMSMRPDEASFSADTLIEAVELTHSHGKRIYVGINSMLFQEDMAPVKEWLTATRDLPFDAIIVADTGVFSLIKELRPELSIHISTQMSTSNSYGAAFWKRAGAKRVILARECTLAHAKEITEKSEIELEIFVHGAMCMAVSGRCLLSAYLCGRSASRGDCKHSCRWEWQLVEQNRSGEEAFPIFETERETVFLGSKDLCLIEHIPQLVQSGLSSLKVEGRMKSEYYVAAVTRVYRAALDSYLKDPDKYQVDPEWLEELEAVSHRPYSTGFAFGYPPEEAESLQTHNSPVSTCEVLGFIIDISDGIHSISVKNPFETNEEIEWIGPDMIGGKVSVKEIYNDKQQLLERSHCGTEVSVTFKQDITLPDNAILRRRLAE